jgi:hypothetical protein
MLVVRLTSRPPKNGQVPEGIAKAQLAAPKGHQLFHPWYVGRIVPICQSLRPVQHVSAAVFALRLGADGTSSKQKAAAGTNARLGKRAVQVSDGRSDLRRKPLAPCPAGGARPRIRLWPGEPHAPARAFTSERLISAAFSNRAGWPGWVPDGGTLFLIRSNKHRNMDAAGGGACPRVGRRQLSAASQAVQSLHDCPLEAHHFRCLCT